MEPPEPVAIAGMRLRFERDGPLVRVTDADQDDRWVGNAFGFVLSTGPFLNPNIADYGDRLGTSAGDPHGARDRRLICQHAKEFRDAQSQG
ncbi:hypothetical protein [Glycomyces sp. NPDC048151]|uniref:hypothetical protein n=1 Tax=Glycomyces sp. NPDC048151 TaxID=3364002 RepID=UPI00371684DC